MTQLDKRLRLAFATAAQWNQWNGVLFAGQIAIESDNLLLPSPSAAKIKIGNGTDLYSDLPYGINGSAAGSATWGDITGTLSSQTDLQSALNGKQPVSDVLSGIAALEFLGDYLIQWDAGNGVFVAIDPETDLKPQLNIVAADIGNSTTVGRSFVTTANPSAVTFARVNADNTVSFLSASDFRAAVGVPASTDFASGSYTPVATNVQNIQAVVVADAYYQKVYSTVNVWGRIEIDPTSSGGTAVGLSLPPLFPSDFTAEGQLAGTANNLSIAGNSLAVRADVGNNRAQIQGAVSTTGNLVFFYHYSYILI